MNSYARKQRQRLLLGCWIILQAAMNVAWAVTRLDHFMAPTFVTVTGDFANFCAFNGLVLFVLMALLGSRNTLIERAFGLDKMLLLHRRLSLWTLGLFVAHAVVRTWSISMEQGIAYDVSFLYRLNVAEWDVVLGRVALMAMAGATALAYMGQKYLLISYKAWKVPHLAMHAALPMGFAHALLRGDDTSEMVMLPLWGLLLAIFLAEAVRRLRYLRHRRHGHVWTIAETRPETRNTASVFLDHPRAPGPFAERKAGQFGVLRVPGIVHMDEPHPFTFSGPGDHAGERRLQVTIKVAGDFTAEFITLPEETRVLVEGPYGVFCADALEKERLAFLAGGVGVTPFLSVLRTMRVQGLAIPTTLIWANRTLADIIAADELAAMAQDMPLQVHHVLSREPAENLDGLATSRTGFHAGRINTELLLRCLNGTESYYLCGPENMMQTSLACLKEAFDIPAKRVAREHFFW
jgi:predicted ferric reductase